MKLFFKILLNFAVVILLLWKLLSNSLIEGHSSAWHSKTIKESIKEKRFIKKVRVIPNKIYCNKTIEINEAWIEESIQQKYHFLFFKEHVHRGIFALGISTNLKETECCNNYQFITKAGNFYSIHESEQDCILMLSIDKISKDTIDIQIISNELDSCKKSFRCIIPD